MARRRPSRRFGDRYAGKVVVVTGASSGFGRQMAVDFAGAGAHVVAVARRQHLLEDLVKEAPGACEAAACDVGDTEAFEQLLLDVMERLGGIDVLVNNAATDPGVRLRDITVEDYRRTFDVNYFAAVAGTLAVLPHMLERGSGIVVNVSSDGGRLPSPGPGAYPSTKAALSAFTESVSFRVERQGVRLHVVYPAWMPTDMGLGALQRGLRRPPRLTRRSTAAVSQRVLERLGGPALDISAAGLIDVAMVVRAAAPRLYHRLRGGWKS